MNKATLVGRLGNDPEIRSLNNGNKVATFRLATEERWKQGNEKKTRTTWHSITVYSQGTVKFLEQYAGKGDKVMVEGIVRYREFEKNDGSKGYATEIAVTGPQHSVEMLASAKPNGAGEKAQAESGFSHDLDEIPF